MNTMFQLLSYWNKYTNTVLVKTKLKGRIKMENISVVLSEDGDFVIEKNIVKAINGKKFYAELSNGDLQLSASRGNNVMSSGNIIMGNNIISANGVSIKSVGNDTYIDTSKNGKIFVNGKLMQEVNENTEDIKDTRVSEFDISSFSVESIRITGVGGLILAKTNTADYIDIKIFGQGDIIIIGIETQSLDIKISGQGNMMFENCTSKKVNAKVSGQGNINGKNNSFNSVNKKISGMGNINL